jgi:CheY-like chemotaxis protein
MAHVLVIDNNLFSRMQLAEVLLSSESEMTVATAAHGSRSVEQYVEHHPDLVIAEIRMQELEGIETILNFRELDHDLPVLLTSRGMPVLLTSHGLPTAALEANAAASSAVHRCSLWSAVRSCLPSPAAVAH